MNKLIISAAITGTGTTKEMNPNVPISPAEIASDSVEVVRAGAAIVHIHVRDRNGAGTMDTEIFEEVYSAVRHALRQNGLDAILNLTTSGGGGATPELRMAHLHRLKPEMCSFDAGTMNWAHRTVFQNPPEFLDQLCACVKEEKIKPEIEIFDGGMMGNALHLMKLGRLEPPCHFQFVLGQLGGMAGTIDSLTYLYKLLPSGSTWSLTGIGQSHIPMMLAGLALGCDGLRVGLEDNLYFSRGIKTTNRALVERAVQLSMLAGREIASAAEARSILRLPSKQQ